MAKRKRDPTFATSEKISLLELVDKYFHVVENKKTDAYSIKRKNEEWQKLADEFNAVSSIHHRDWAVLKNCWENMKKRAKQINTMRNQHFLGTGGGPPKKFIDDPAIEKTLDLIKTRVTGYINCFDSDGTHILASGSDSGQLDTNLEHENLNIKNDNNECPNTCHVDANDSVPVDANDSVPVDSVETVIIDWSQYTPSMLKESINPALVRTQSPSVDIQLNPERHESDHNTQGQSQALSTPSRINTERTPTIGLASTSRRRPTVRRDRETQSLAMEKIQTLLLANTHAEEEHTVQMNILRLREETEREILSQEKIKTEQEKIKLEILKLELERK